MKFSRTSEIILQVNHVVGYLVRDLDSEPLEFTKQYRFFISSQVRSSQHLKTFAS